MGDDMERGLKTHFASPERADLEALHASFKAALGNPMISSLLWAFGSLVAVLNEHRQILSLNDELLTFMGIDSGEAVFGLRPGEALHCVRAQAAPSGCGTGRACMMCGAAISIVLAQEEGRPVERECLLRFKDAKGFDAAIEFKVRAIPVEVQAHQFILLLMQDFSDEKRREAIEQTFLHDFNNVIGGILSNAQLLSLSDMDDSPLIAEQLVYLAKRATDEIKHYQVLARAEQGDFKPKIQAYEVKTLIRDVYKTFKNHPASSGVHLHQRCLSEAITLETDRTLFHRIMTNMVKNALEATPSGGEIKLWCELEREEITFYVWNAGLIPEETAMRIFQRYFSTKSTRGRGLGTYSMKLLGERYLKGAVRFTTSLEGGTVFEFSSPLRFGG